MTTDLCFKLRDGGRDNLLDVQKDHVFQKRVSDEIWEEATHVVLFAYGSGINPQPPTPREPDALCVYRCVIDKENSESYQSVNGRCRNIKFHPSDEFWNVGAGDECPIEVPKFNPAGYAIIHS